LYVVALWETLMDDRFAFYGLTNTVACGFVINSRFNQNLLGKKCEKLFSTEMSAIIFNGFLIKKMRRFVVSLKRNDLQKLPFLLSQQTMIFHDPNIAMIASVTFSFFVSAVESRENPNVEKDNKKAGKVEEDGNATHSFSFDFVVDENSRKRESEENSSILAASRANKSKNTHKSGRKNRRKTSKRSSGQDNYRLIGIRVDLVRVLIYFLPFLCFVSLAQRA
jgi:hypothetical protein